MVKCKDYKTDEESLERLFTYKKNEIAVKEKDELEIVKELKHGGKDAGGAIISSLSFTKKRLNYFKRVLLRSAGFQVIYSAIMLGIAIVTFGNCFSIYKDKYVSGEIIGVVDRMGYGDNGNTVEFLPVNDSMLTEPIHDLMRSDTYVRLVATDTGDVFSILDSEMIKLVSNEKVLLPGQYVKMHNVKALDGATMKLNESSKKLNVPEGTADADEIITVTVHACKIFSGLNGNALKTTLVVYDEEFDNGVALVQNRAALNYELGQEIMVRRAVLDEEVTYSLLEY